jgi:hypothetical protein
MAARRAPSRPSPSYQRDRQAAVRRGYTWVAAHQTRRGPVRGFWRRDPGVGTVLTTDLQQHIEQALRQHAAAVSAGFADRADAIKSQLVAYAAQLSAMQAQGGR